MIATPVSSTSVLQAADFRRLIRGTRGDAFARERDILEWVDLNLIVDEQQRRSLRRRSVNVPAVGLPICQDIPDTFTFLQSELTEPPQARTAPHLPT